VRELRWPGARVMLPRAYWQFIDAAYPLSMDVISSS
jgi:hypothetical protein